jgi:hypothetical protein
MNATLYMQNLLGFNLGTLEPVTGVFMFPVDFGQWNSWDELVIPSINTGTRYNLANPIQFYDYILIRVNAVSARVAAFNGPTQVYVAEQHPSTTGPTNITFKVPNVGQITSFEFDSAVSQVVLSVVTGSSEVWTYR